MLRRGSGVPLNLGLWQAPRFYVYEAGEIPGVPKDLLYIKESAWGPAASQVGPAPVFLGKHLELQATETNRTPLRGRKTIELGAGCGLVSMVAALLGAEAHACEENGPSLALLQHNVATFNSEFAKCHPIRACEFPTSATLRGFFDLIFVTDLLNSPSGRMRTLKCLVHLLSAQTECVVVHAWRNHEAEKTFFDALGKFLLVNRLDGQRDIQKRCMQAISRSIADSARDIHEATDEDGSIEIFSMKPHADVSESLWRSEATDLLLQLQREEATQKCTYSCVSPLAMEAAGATDGETASLCSEEKNTDRHAVSLSSCSTLSSMHGGLQLAQSISSSGVINPAKRQASKGHQGKLLCAHQSEPAESNSAALQATTARAGTNVSSTPGVLRNMSQPLLHQNRLLYKTAHTAAKAKGVDAVPKGVPRAAASSCEPGSPSDAARVRPKTSTTATASSRGAHLHGQQRMPVNREGGPNNRKAVAAGSKGLISPPLSPATACSTCPGPAFPHQTLPAIGTAAKKPTPTEKRKLLPKLTPPEARECNLGVRSATTRTVTPKDAAAVTATLQRTPAAKALSFTATGTLRPTKISTAKTSSDCTTVAALAKAETTVTGKLRVLQAPRPLRPQTCVPPPQHSTKRLGPLLPALGVPKSQPRRSTADGSPTASQEAAASNASLQPRQKSLLVDAAYTPGAAAAATPTTTIAARAAPPKSNGGPAFAFDKYAAPNAGTSERTLKVAAAAGPTLRQQSGVGPEASNESTCVARGGTPKRLSSTSEGSRSVSYTLGPVLGQEPAVNAHEIATATAVTAEGHRPAAVKEAATKEAIAATRARRESVNARAPVEAKAGAPSVGSTTAGGPLGARLVSRLSGLFKRSGSKDMKNK